MSAPDEEGDARPPSAGKLKEEAEATFKGARLRQMWSDKHFKHVQYAEKFAVIAFWLGVLSLTIFASVNVYKATLASTTPSLQYITHNFDSFVGIPCYLTSCA